MRFDVSSTALLSRLQSISKVIASKNSLPILDSFLFSLEGNKLTITASDAETRLVTSVDVMNGQGSGLFAVSAKILLDPLKELPEQPLTFDINDEIWKSLSTSRTVNIILSGKKEIPIRSRNLWMRMRSPL